MTSEAASDTKSVDESPEKRGIGAHLVTLIKIGVAVGLFAWILSNPKFQSERLLSAFRSPFIPLILVLGFTAISLSGVRWMILLRGEGIRVPLLTILKLTWIGHFWNMVIPGAVSGDAVKMFYIGKAAPDLREEAWTTVFADRVIGMAALISLSTIAALSSLEFVFAHEELKPVFLFMVLLLGAVAAGFAVVMFGVGRSWSWVARLSQRIPLRDMLARAYESLHRVSRRPKALVLTFFISLIAHVIAVGNAYLLGKAASEELLAFTQYCVVVPIAMFSNAIPISPGGLGVGENVLAKLFQWSGGAWGDGINVMLLTRANFYALAVFGALVYVLYKRGPGPQESPAPAVP